MESIKDYAEKGFQKDMVTQILKQAFLNIGDEEQETITNLVIDKIDEMNSYRTDLAAKADPTLDSTADEFGISPQVVLDTFIYFTLIVENVWLTKKLEDITRGEG